jgi:DNA polymerase IV
MVYQSSFGFYKEKSSKLHIDLNSCFASVEQQANPLIRDKPVAVAAYTTPSGCIVAPSVEAKALGVKLGMRVREGKVICPSLIVLPPDPDKYRNVHLRLKNLLLEYTDRVVAKSIDEFVLDLAGYPAFEKGMHEMGREIKKRIKNEIGDWLRVSIGIGPNRFLAKQASNLNKPDGLDEINFLNYEEIYSSLKLKDLHGINKGWTSRLNIMGIYEVMDLYRADRVKLKSVFKSIASYHWFMRLRGWEVDDVDFGRKSFSSIYSLPKPLNGLEELKPILCKLVEKVGRRMRREGCQTKGLYLGILYKSGRFWHGRVSLKETLDDSRDIYKRFCGLTQGVLVHEPVIRLTVSCFNLTKTKFVQLNLFDKDENQVKLVVAMDKVNDKWQEYMIAPAIMVDTKKLVPDRIGFGNTGISTN